MAKEKKEKPAREKKEKPVREPKPKKERPVKEKKPKPEKEPKEKKPGLMDKFKKKQNPEEDGFDMMTEIKEPFSLQGFFEQHVVEKFKRAKNILQEKGILFFLTSPFQARGRMVALLTAIVAGLLLGVVPKASFLINATRDKAYASEIYGLDDKTVGSISLHPAASSNYKRMHMLAFIVTGKNLPSDPESYEVHLGQGTGASDWDKLTYSWNMYPVDDTRRILLVAIDQSKQPSGVGMFRLFIQLKGEELKSYAKTPYEVTLSSAQETTSLYDRTGIHLSALTEAVCGKGEIEKKQKEYEEALDVYRKAVEQAEKMPIEDIKVSPSVDDLEAYCLKNRMYRALKDDSNTEDILDIEPEVKATLSLETKIECGGTYGGIYDQAFIAELQANTDEDGNPADLSDEENRIFKEWQHVETAKNSVLSAMDGVNTAAEAWYNTLVDYRLILNQTVMVNSFPLYARITADIEGEIDFIDGSPEDPSDSEDPGVHGQYGGDEDPVDDPPVTDEPPVEEPEQPVIEPEPEEPAVEEPAVEGPEEPATEEPVEEPAEEPVEEPVEEPSQTEKPEPESKPYKPNPAVTGDGSDNK